MIPGMMAVWQLRYKYCRYGDAWDTSAEHNGTRYVVPWPTKDLKIPLKGWQVFLATTAEIGISSFSLIKDCYQDFQRKQNMPLKDERKGKANAKLSYQPYDWEELLCEQVYTH